MYHVRSGNDPQVTYYYNEKRALYTSTRVASADWTAKRAAVSAAPMSLSLNERTGETILRFDLETTKNRSLPLLVDSGSDCPGCGRIFVQSFNRQGDGRSRLVGLPAGANGFDEDVTCEVQDEKRTVLFYI